MSVEAQAPAGAPARVSRVYTRFMARHYAWFVLIALLAIACAVTALDVSPEILRVWTETSAAGTGNGVARSAFFVFLRLLDNGVQAFPIAFVIGILWAEAVHARSGRLTMVRTAGMDFVRRLKGLAVVAALSVPLLFILDNTVRPWAMITVSVNGLGEYGWRYADDRKAKETWLAFDGTVVQANLEDAPDPTLSDVTVYRFRQDGSLHSIVEADRLILDRGQWTLLWTRSWTFADPGDGGAGSDAAAFATTEAAPLGFAISPLWLQYRGIHPKYVPLADLAALAAAEGLPDDHPPYREWLVIRVAQALVPALIVLCLAAIFALVLDSSGPAAAGGAALFAGYFAYFLARISTVLAENQLAPAPLAAAALPVCLVLVFAALLAALRRRDRLA